MIAEESSSLGATFVSRVRRFVHKPWREKLVAVNVRYKRIFGRLPVPVRLPVGCWWLAGGDALGRRILSSTFENAEVSFVQRFLRAGMTVLDIGAHQGLYTLLASRMVGPLGRVVSFEPSPRERRRLGLHLFLNRCGNVKVESLALGKNEGEATFFVVDGRDTGCNSLRPPAIREPTSVIQVSVARVDDVLCTYKIDEVDFIKIDVEGAELDVLSGAERLLESRPRPVMLVEVSDTRTGPWGYKARDILVFLEERGYRWFRPAENGTLRSIRAGVGHWDDNLVAVPQERMEEIRYLMDETD
jgi:FkbM family methyltransferase